MVCETIKPGIECLFMSPKGCTFNGGACHPVVEECIGCGRVREFKTGEYCIAVPNPSVKWATGPCNLATHIKRENGRAKQRINPLKASKKNARGL